jgi:hypothetical protein
MTFTFTALREDEGFVGRRLDSPSSNFSAFTSAEQKENAVLPYSAIRKITL